MSLAARDTQLRELMDDPGCDRVRLARTLRRFGAVNRGVSGWGGVYRRHIRAALAEAERPVRILDIGCGGGDVLRRLVRLARRDGLEASGLGIDPDIRAIDTAHASARLAGVSYRAVGSGALVTAGERFDLVVSNHVLHHLDGARFEALIHDSTALTRLICVHSDIARGRLAYAAFAAASLPLAPGSFIRVDGLRSIRRSFTRAELAELLPADWRVESARPFRVLAVHKVAARAHEGGSAERRRP